MALKSEKVEQEKIELKKLQADLKENNSEMNLKVLADLNLTPEKTSAVEGAILAIAKNNVQEMQGQYYETYD